MNLEQSLKGKRVLITGCGYSPVKHIFTDIVTGEPTHNEIIIDGKPQKLNIGAATAYILANAGATVHMVSHSEDKLRNLRKVFSETLDERLFEYTSLDLFNEKETRKFCVNISRDLPLYWVQSVGVTSGAVNIKNPYQNVENLTVDQLRAELEVIIATHVMTQGLLPIFKQQKESRLAFVTSMSAVRAYPGGCGHCPPKAGLDKYVNSLMLEKYKENIFVSTIRPGAIDTGSYDEPEVQKYLTDVVSKSYDGQFDKHFALAPPSEVGKKILMALTSESQDTYNIVARGQWPHQGS